jgi:signal peptidase II
MSLMSTETKRAASLLWGPLTRFGLVVALVTAAIDQALKLWLLFIVDLGQRGIVTLTPFLDLVLTWNTGISYRLFRRKAIRAMGPAGAEAYRRRFAVDLAVAGNHAPPALSLGLIVGGAIGNASTGAYGAVADFVLFHVSGVQLRLVRFNLADVVSSPGS